MTEVKRYEFNIHADDMKACEDGDYVLFADHEAALAAERENTRIADNLADHWEKQANKATQDAAAKDARIAELEKAKRWLVENMGPAIAELRALLGDVK